MKEKNGKQADSRIMGNLAAVEQYLEALKAEFERAEFRPNELVKSSIGKGTQEVEKAVGAFTTEDYDSAERSVTIAWLHAYFARSIFDAETTEHYLGESDFLELGEDIEDWRGFALEELKSMEKEIVELRQEINAASNGGGRR